jgi:predicted phage terminase large subunit-like protein
MDDLDSKTSPAGGAHFPSLEILGDGFSNDVLRKMAEDDLYFFAKSILGFDWLDIEIHGDLCNLLQDYETNRRMRVVLPRSWLKTTLCSIAYPIWRAVKSKGNIRVLLVQNTYDNAVAKLSVIREQFEKNQVLRTLWPELLPQERDVWKGDSLCLHRSESYPESTFEAAGTKTQTISRHYNLIIEDDTVAPRLNELGEENVAPVKEDIKQAIGYHRGVVDLQVDFLHDQILIVGTRWFEKDLISWSQEHEPTYLHYQRACLEDATGNADENGTPTYPKRFPMEVLIEIRNAKGPYMFSCLYLNKPVRSVDMLFMLEWFRDYDFLPTGLAIYTTVDVGGSEEDTKGEPDWSVVITCGKSIYTGKIFVLEVWREKANPSDIINAIIAHVKKWHPLIVGVEATNLEKIILPFIRVRMFDEKLYFRLEGIHHGNKSKRQRILGLQPFLARGDVFFRKHHQNLKSELLAYPLGAHDDLADTLAMQTAFWLATKSVAEEQPAGPPSPNSLDGIIESIVGRQSEEFLGDLLHRDRDDYYAYSEN